MIPGLIYISTPVPGISWIFSVYWVSRSHIYSSADHGNVQKIIDYKVL